MAGACNLHYAYRAVVFDTVVPETRGRELLSDDYSHAMYYTLAHSHNVSCGRRNMSKVRVRAKTYHLKTTTATSSFYSNNKQKCYTVICVTFSPNHVITQQEKM